MKTANRRAQAQLAMDEYSRLRSRLSSLLTRRPMFSSSAKETLSSIAASGRLNKWCSDRASNRGAPRARPPHSPRGIITCSLSVSDFATLQVSPPNFVQLNNFIQSKLHKRGGPRRKAEEGGGFISLLLGVKAE